MPSRNVPEHRPWFYDLPDESEWNIKRERNHEQPQTKCQPRVSNLDSGVGASFYCPACTPLIR